MKLELFGGHVALLDDSDWPMLAGHGWYAKRERNTWYAVANGPKKIRPRPHFKMHRLILNAPPGAIVDHINRNGLDNRRANLRLATSAQNAQNRISWKHDAGRYKGVFQSATGWCARIGGGTKVDFAGPFDSPELAARAYDAMAIRKFGEFAFVNFPNKNEKRAA